MDRKRDSIVEQLETADHNVVEGERMLETQRHLIVARKASGIDVELAERVLSVLVKVQAARVAKRDGLLAEIALRPRPRKTP